MFEMCVTMSQNKNSFEATCFSPDHSYDIGRAKNLIIIAFDQQGRIMTIKKKGITDVVRGRVEWDDESYADAARREMFEATGAIFTLLKLSAVIAPKENKLEIANQKDHTLVMAGRIGAIDRPQGSRKYKPIFLDMKKLLLRYNAGRIEDLEKLIVASLLALTD